MFFYTNISGISCHFNNLETSLEWMERFTSVGWVACIWVEKKGLETAWRNREPPIYETAKGI